MTRGFIISVAAVSCLFLFLSSMILARVYLKEIAHRFDQGDVAKLELQKKDVEILQQLSELKGALNGLLDRAALTEQSNYSISFRDLVRIAPGQELRVIRDSWRDRSMADWSAIGKRDTPEGFTWVGSYREAETETVFQLYLEKLQ